MRTIKILVEKSGCSHSSLHAFSKISEVTSPFKLAACPARPEGPVSGAITKIKLGASLGLSSFLDSAADPLDGGAERARLLPSASGAAVGEHEVLHGDHVVQRQADDPTE